MMHKWLGIFANIFVKIPIFIGAGMHSYSYFLRSRLCCIDAKAIWILIIIIFAESQYPWILSHSHIYISLDEILTLPIEREILEAANR